MIRVEIGYWLAQAAAIRPAGPAPMMRRSTSEESAGAMVVQPLVDAPLRTVLLLKDVLTSNETRTTRTDDSSRPRHRERSIGHEENFSASPNRRLHEPILYHPLICLGWLESTLIFSVITYQPATIGENQGFSAGTLLCGTPIRLALYFGDFLFSYCVPRYLGLGPSQIIQSGIDGALSNISRAVAFYLVHFKLVLPPSSIRDLSQHHESIAHHRRYHWERVGVGAEKTKEDEESALLNTMHDAEEAEANANANANMMTSFRVAQQSYRRV